MTAETPPRSSRTHVVLAALFVLVLGVLLAARLVARDGEPEAAPATVPQPARVVIADLEVPCWSCPAARGWPLRFRTDLDLLAPLGDGRANAAEYFMQFEKDRGPRYEEAQALAARRQSPPAELEWVGAVVPPDDPLLLEAQPWVDQAEMRFYPDVFPMEGYETRITNLLYMLHLARSWIARGLQAEDPRAGLEDCRRAIRLGRLLRQEDVVLINDLVGLACIHLGSRGVYEIALRTGDLELSLLASVVIGEVAPQHLYSSQRVTSVDTEPFLRRTSDGGVEMDLPEAHVDTIVEMLTSCPDRRFRGEATLGSHIVLYHGTPEQQAKVRTALEQVATGDDPIQADFARKVLAEPPSQKLLAEVLEARG